MEASQESIHAEIIRLTPGWVDYRNRAERSAHLDANLNQLEKNAIAPINHLLEKLSDLALEELVERQPVVA